MILLFLSVSSLAAAGITGRFSLLTPALLEGAGAGVTLCLTLAGPVCLWSGVSEVFGRAGISRVIARAAWPLVSRLIGPKEASLPLRASLAENFSSNLLGIGNAATPAGLKAEAMLEENGDHRAAARLVLLNASSVQLIPLTAAAMRASHGASRPMDILGGVLFASVISLAVAFGVFGLVSRRG